MSDCPDCQRAETNPRTARFTATCRECTARSLAQSPAFFDSARSEALTPTYRSALQFFFGGDWKAGHEMVKQWAGRLT